MKVQLLGVLGSSWATRRCKAARESVWQHVYAGEAVSCKLLLVDMLHQNKALAATCHMLSWRLSFVDL